MSEEKTWDDATRQKLGEQLCAAIAGQMRLAKRNADAILEYCREVYLQDDCPKDEHDGLMRLAADDMARYAAKLAFEQASWPVETDCDRLDRVEVALRQRGIVFWQASPCCDSCTSGDLPNRIAGISDRYPGFGQTVRGYTFFIEQNIPESLVESTQISVYLSYGWISHDETEVANDVYKLKAMAIAREVSGCLRDEGFETGWDGDVARKIGISINWQRRTLLE